MTHHFNLVLERSDWHATPEPALAGKRETNERATIRKEIR
jgi:hypothetical protein